MHIKQALTAGTLLTALFAHSVMGQETPKDDKTKDGQTLSDVVVTATKTTRSTESVANSVTVIDEDEIKAKGHSTVVDVLRGTPGIDIARNGGPGTMASVFMRGADSKNVLLMVDGVPYNNPSGANRNAAFSTLTTGNIQRIEIIRGPQSVLYGSNATAGVINIITKEGTGKPSVTYRTEAGSYDTFRNTLSTSGTIDRLSFSLSGDFLESQGISASNRENGDLPDDGNRSEKDGYRSETYSGSLKYRFTDDFYIALTGRFTEAEVETDEWGPGYTGDNFLFPWEPPFPPTTQANIVSPFKQEVHTDEMAIRMDINNVFADGLFESNFYGSHSEFKTQNYDNDGERSYDNKGRVEQYGWQGNINTSNNILSIGTDLYREYYLSDSSDVDQNADTRSVWLQNQFEIGGFYVVIGGRNDHHDRFGDHTTYRVASAYTFESETKIKASHGTGFRAPSLFELYSSYGDELFQPEESKGWDVGIEQKIGDVATVGITYFETEYQDKIDYDFTTSAYAQFHGDTDMRGVEFFSKWRATDYLGFLLNYTYTDTENDAGERLVRRPLHKALLSTDLRLINKLRANLDIHYSGDRDAVSSAKDQYDNTVKELDSYVLVDLGLKYDVCPGFQVYGRVDNVFDEEYEYAWSYGTPGRSYYVGCSLTF